MADSGSGAWPEAPEAAAVADLNSQLNKAYLSGNGAEVERVMALIAATQHSATQHSATQHSATQQLVPSTVARREARVA